MIRCLLVLFSTATFCAVANAQTAKVDFQKDVQPILKANCTGCHGPTQQMNNFRLDRRRDAMRGGTIAVIAPGSSQSSHLYLRLIGKDNIGMPMPPTGSMPPENIEIIRKWIDQGAEWPDAVSGDTPPPPPDPKAARLMETLRAGDRQAFQKLLREDVKAAKAKGPGGSTALMYAVLYSDAEAVRLLLRSGADPNARNEAGATALMWAVTDLEKTRLLLAGGADVNARSSDGRTPLMIAARRSGGKDVVKLLLEKGANASAKAGGLLGEVTPISEAMYASDEPIFRLLVDHGADRKAAGPLALAFAFRARCDKCVQELIGGAGPNVLIPAAFFVSPPLGPGFAVKTFVERGVDAKLKAPDGRSLLLVNAASEGFPLDSIRTLIEKGADVNDKAPDGQTALDVARRHGQTPVVDLLLKSGAKPGTMPPPSAMEAKPAMSIRAALERSVPLLQRTDATFLKKAGCVSCHNNSLAAVAVAAARKHGVRVDEESTRRHVKTIGNYIDSWRERALQAVGIPGDADTVSYLLLGLSAEKFPADAATDAMAYFVKHQQMSDGRWQPLAHRPPIESSEIQVTAISLRALQLYPIQSQRAEYEKSVRAAAAWLEKAQPHDTQDRAFQLLALGWTGARKEAIQSAANALVKEQRPDGGWSQTATLASDAYATGQALLALQESGALKASDAACARASRFLLNTQRADGSWFVRSRAIPLQPFFESDFPYGHDQWISAAATGWSTTALAMMTQ
ncbi:MAG: ankyrin repeat domain-containing protein [Candidatus Solibacter usitatus]|nr:ankyrin repeat domain-containing protein [Candidatus Solibacter usitatus]